MTTLSYTFFFRVLLSSTFAAVGIVACGGGSTATAPADAGAGDAAKCFVVDGCTLGLCECVDFSRSAYEETRTGPNKTCAAIATVCSSFCMMTGSTVSVARCTTSAEAAKGKAVATGVRFPGEPCNPDRTAKVGFCGVYNSYLPCPDKTTAIIPPSTFILCSPETKTCPSEAALIATYCGKDGGA
jgi:hypothetical protein